MASTTRKPLWNNANLPGRRVSDDSKSFISSSVPTSTGQGLARTPSLRQSRPVRKATNRSNNSLSADVEEDEEARASNMQLISELKEQVQKAEFASEQYQKQLDVLQKRLDQFAAEQTVAEEKEQQRQFEIARLHAEFKESARQRREMEQSFEAEKNLLLRDRERRATREEELQSVIQRLNETVRLKGARNHEAGSSNPQSPELGIQHFDAEASQAGRAMHDAMEELLEKDRTIDALRLDLAESQLRLAEMEHLGDGRVQALEKSLIEARMTNARLMEDNESFQLLLSEKTLKGDFMNDARGAEETKGMSSLAEELESVGDDAEGQTELQRKLEAEVKGLKESNKALTLYIDKIIGRLLQHEGFEHIIHERDEAPEVPAKVLSTEKALPAIPDQPVSSFLQRAKSVVSRPAPVKARPQSYMPPPTANENPDTAPSIPLKRGHRRVRSDQAQTDLGAAALVQQMNRGSPLRTASGGTMSPGRSPLSPQLNPTRVSYFPTGNTGTVLTTSGSGAPGGRGSSATSIVSEQSGEKDSTDASSAQAGSQGTNIIPGAVMKQNQLRPLRLVREQAANDNDLQKKGNRNSWVGWLRGSTLEAQSE